MESNDKTSNNVSNLRRDLFNEHGKNVILQSRIDQLEQTQRECNVRVRGYPEHGESDTAIKHQLVQLVGAIEGSENNTVSITRTGKARDGKSRDLVIKFDLKENRDNFYALRKRTPKNNQNKKVYINEDLIEPKAKLFYDTRRLVKRGRLYGTWSQNGNIMVKVNENDAPCAIQNHSELRSMLRHDAFDSDQIEDELSTTSDLF